MSDYLTDIGDFNIECDMDIDDMVDFDFSKCGDIVSDKQSVSERNSVELTFQDDPTSLQSKDEYTKNLLQSFKEIM